MEAPDRVVFVGGGELPPSLDLTFPPTGLSENLGEWKGGGEGKGKVGETTCLTPPWLLPQIPTWLQIVLSCLDEPSIVVV